MPNLGNELIFTVADHDYAVIASKDIGGCEIVDSDKNKLALIVRILPEEGDSWPFLPHASPPAVGLGNFCGRGCSGPPNR